MSSDSSKFWGYFFIFLSVAVAIVCGFIVLKIYKLGIICAGVASGFFLAMLLNLMFLFKIESNPSSLIINSTIVYLGVLGGIIAYEFEDHIVIISTAFIGSYTFVRALSVPIGHFPNEFQFSQNIKNGSLKFSWTVKYKIDYFK